MKKAIVEVELIRYSIQCKYNSMKINSLNTRQKSGFTLVELLVVMAIIASLAALSFVGFGRSVKQARKVASLNHLTNIVGGIEGFYSDNSVYPTVASGATAVTVTVNAADSSEMTDGSGTLIQMLLAEETITPVQNKRKIKYIDGMQANEAKNDGVDYSTAGYPVKDYEGIPYQIIWDGNYDDKLDDPFGGTAPVRSRIIGLGQGASTSPLSGTMTSKDQVQIVKTW